MGLDNGSPSRERTSVQGKRLAVVVVHTWAPGANALDYQDACSQGLGPDVDVQVVRVAGFEAVRKAAEEAVQAGAWLIISVGGDGTANAIVNGMGASSTRLIVLPAGTGNGLNYQLGQSSRPEEVASLLRQFEEVEIDAMRVNGIHRCFLGATLGFYSEMSAGINRLRAKDGLTKKLIQALGKVAYTYALWSVLRNYRNVGGLMKICYFDIKDGIKKTQEIDAMCLLVTGFPGTDEFPFLPFSDIADGKFEIVIWSRMNFLRLLKFLAGFKTGEHFNMPEALQIQTNYCEVECSRPMEMFLDGEPIPSCSSYIFDILPGAIPMMAPKGIYPGSRELSRKYT